MTPTRHARVRAVFSKAVELDASARARFLDGSCGNDAALRREVDSLLEHHFAASIVTPPALPPAVPPQSAESRTHVFSRPGYWGAGVVALVVGLLLLGWWTHARVEAAVRQMRAGELETILSSRSAAFDTWVKAEQAQLRLLASTAEFRQPALKLLEMAKTGEAAIPALISSPERERLGAYLNSHRDDSGYPAFDIFDTRGLQVFASHGTAGAQLNDNGLAVLARTLAGQSVFEKPYRVGTMFADADIEGTMYTVVGVPIRGDDGRVEGALAATRQAYRAFADIVTMRLGETGEIYAFDQRGIMLTPSPFGDDLRTLALLPVARDRSREWDASTQLNLRLRDPGRPLSPDAPASDDDASLPLTRLASTALARGPMDDAVVVLLDPYRNYRGAEVIGAWRWLPEYRFVLAAEMETVEAYAPLRRLNATLRILLGLLVLAVAAVVIASFQVTRLQRRLRDLKQLGQYRLLEPIGQGGMGRVYLAEHAGLKRRTAVKILSPELHSPEAIARFEREVQVASRLTHPNTIDIYDYGRTDDGVFYYAMEFIDGLSLAELVSRFGPVPAGRAVHLLEQVCCSLKEAHDQGIIHRDIKPLNIMVCRQGGRSDVVKVLDFGLAKLSEEGISELTRSARVGGTLMYMAPERFTSPERSDVRIDIYSLGGVAYYLLTGKPPFEPIHDLDLIHQIATARPRAMSEVGSVEVPSDLERLVMDCLEKLPERRPPTLDEVQQRLHAIAVAIGWREADAARWWAEREATVESA